MHNKFLISVLAAVLLGSLLGHTLFKKYQQEDMQTFQAEDSVYVIQEGVYDNEERAKNATVNLDTKLIVKEDAKYYVYLAMTQNNDNLKRLKKMFEDLKIDIEVKKMNIESASFLTSLEQMDGLLKQVKSNDEILTINRVILANYEELILS